MIFSTVLLAIKATKEEQQKGLHPHKYEIDLSDIISDYNSMKAYEATIESASPSFKAEFAKEVKSFYLVVDKLYLNKNNLAPSEYEMLGRIYFDTKRLKDTLALLLRKENIQLT